MIGREVRALRKNRNLTIAQLANHAECSVGYLSEVERDQRTVTIKSLQSIAAALEVPIGWFFAHEQQAGGEARTIVRAQSRKRIGNGDDGLFEELLSPDISGPFEMFLTRIEPGSRSDGTIRRDVLEEGYIAEGALQMTIEDRAFDLQKGDSFRIDRVPFSWVNDGERTTSVLWVTSPPIY